MTLLRHPSAPQTLPVFIVSPGEPDYLMLAMAGFLIAFVVAAGLLYLRLHMLPDHIAHRSQKVQYEIVGVLGLLAMFTHINAFWIAGLLLALVDLPDFGTPLSRMARALNRIAADRRYRPGSEGGRGFGPSGRLIGALMSRAVRLGTYLEKPDGPHGPHGSVSKSESGGNSVQPRGAVDAAQGGGPGEGSL